MSKKSFIDSVKVGSACGEDWGEMDGNERVRFCSHCSKHVNNLSEMTRKEAARFVSASGGKICIRYIVDPVTRRPMFAEQLLQITRRTPGLAAGVMTASMSLSSVSYAQSETPPNYTPPPTTVTAPNDLNREKKSIETRDGGRVSGTVVDPNGAVVPGVSVTINGERSGGSTTTDSDGSYQLTNLEPGSYTVTVGPSPGFKTSVVQNLVISDDQNLSQNITLEPGELVALGGMIAAVEYTSPLSQAIASDDVDAVRDLLAKGAKVNAKEESYSKITPLFVAVENGNVEIVRLLLEFGAKVNRRDENKQTPLMRLDGDATPELVDLLIRHGAKVNAVDSEGNTALLTAVYSSPAVLKALIEAGADVNIANKEKETPLMRAAESDLIENVQALLLAGADVNAEDSDGDTALDRAANQEVRDFLVRSGARSKTDVETPSEPQGVATPESRTITDF